MLLTMEQRTEEWFNWRLKGVTSSDVIRCWFSESKDSLIDNILHKFSPPSNLNPKSQKHIRRGIHFEPIARDFVNLTWGGSFRPVCCQHDVYPYLISSLDGLSEDGNIVLEIKCPSISNFNKLDEFSFDLKHYYQIQWASLISQCKELWLVYYNAHKSPPVKRFIFNPDKNLHSLLLRFGVFLHNIFEKIRGVNDLGLARTIVTNEVRRWDEYNMSIVWPTTKQ